MPKRRRVRDARRDEIDAVDLDDLRSPDWDTEDEPTAGSAPSQSEVDEDARSDAEPVLYPSKRGRGNRAGWKTWSLDPVIEEHNCIALIRKRHPAAIAIRAGATFVTQSGIATPEFSFSLVVLEPLTNEALGKLHPCLLYRLLWLDGQLPGKPHERNRMLRKHEEDARKQIAPTRSGSRASELERRRSSKAKLVAAHAHKGRRGLRQYELKKGRNNTAEELRVIDVRLRILKQELGWSDARLGGLIIESNSVWKPAPCSERVRRWQTDEAEGSKKAEEWVRARLRN